MLKKSVFKATVWSLFLSIGLGIQTFLFVQEQLLGWFPFLVIALASIFFLIPFDENEMKLGSYRCTLSSLSVLIIVFELSQLLFVFVKPITLPVLISWIPVGIGVVLSLSMLLMVLNGVLTARELKMS